MLSAQNSFLFIFDDQNKKIKRFNGQRFILLLPLHDLDMHYSHQHRESMTCTLARHLFPSATFFAKNLWLVRLVEQTFLQHGIYPRQWTLQATRLPLISFLTIKTFVHVAKEDLLYPQKQIKVISGYKSEPVTEHALDITTPNKLKMGGWHWRG